MTRDEAIAAAEEVAKRHVLFHEGIIDVLVALGLLKLDEPKTIGQRVEEIVSRHVSERQRGHILGALRNEGLL